MTHHPPRLAQWILERSLPAKEREELIGDLNEEFRERLATLGPAQARRWYWRHAVLLATQGRRLDATSEQMVPAGRQAVWADAGSDLRHGWRSLRLAPVYSSVAVLSIVVSLGLATAVFSIVRTVILEPLAVPTANRLVRLGLSGPGVFTGGNRHATTVGAAPAPPLVPDVLLGSWMPVNRTLESMTVYSTTPQTIVLDDESVRVDVAAVGPTFFDVLPVRPLAGRTIQPRDMPADEPRVAVLSARLVSPRHADSESVVGQTVTIDSIAYDVVGVLPADFEWPNRTVDVWTLDRWRPPVPGQSRQMGRAFLTLGLMRPGFSVDDVRREGQQLADQIAADGTRLYPGNSGPLAVVARLVKDELIQPVRPALTLLIAGTIGILVAANVTLIGFLLSRNAGRRRDLAVRQALGASGWRLVRPLLAEQLWLGLIGLAGALGLASLLIEALPLVAPHDLPGLALVSLDQRSFLFAAIVSLATALGVGLLPARSLVNSNLRVAVADGGASVAGVGRSTERLRSRLVVGQLCVATALLVGSGLVGRSLMAMLHIDTGYQPERVLTFQLGTRPPSFAMTGPVTQFYEALFASIRALPGVESVGLSNALPLHGAINSERYSIPGLTPPQPDGVRLETQREHVSAEYLQTLGVTLVAGRFFDSQDIHGAQRVVVVNEPFVQTFLPGVAPLGQVAPYGVNRPVIVGVIRPIKRGAATFEDAPAMYLPASQSNEAVSLWPGRGMGVAVRTSGDPAALSRSIQEVVRELDPAVPVYNLMPLSDRVARSYAQPRFFAIALMMFAVLAVGTTVIGVYGILAASVERRRVELGVRRALGASTMDMVSLIVGQALRRAAIGIAIGVGIAVVGANLGRSALYGIATVDAVSYLGAILAVVAVVLIGAWVPMRTALRIDPARVLKAE